MLSMLIYLIDVTEVSLTIIGAINLYAFKYQLSDIRLVKND